MPTPQDPKPTPAWAGRLITGGAWAIAFALLLSIGHGLGGWLGFQAVAVVELLALAGLSPLYQLVRDGIAEHPPGHWGGPEGRWPGGA
jgi:hypothetical protein